MSTNDKELMVAVRNGNHVAFETLVKHHTARFQVLAYNTLQDKDLADEAVQTAFIKLWQRPSSWDSKKSQFTTWFYRVVLNVCHDLRRKNSKFCVAEESALDLLAQPSESQEILLEKSQKIALEQHYLELAISKLPAVQKDALNLAVYSSLPQKEVAEILGVSVKAVESLLVRAKRSLRKQVAQYVAQESPTSKYSEQ